VQAEILHVSIASIAQAFYLNPNNTNSSSRHCFHESCSYTASLIWPHRESTQFARAGRMLKALWDRSDKSRPCHGQFKDNLTSNFSCFFELRALTSKIQERLPTRCHYPLLRRGLCPQETIHTWTQWLLSMVKMGQSRRSIRLQVFQFPQKVFHMKYFLWISHSHFVRFAISIEEMSKKILLNLTRFAIRLKPLRDLQSDWSHSKIKLIHTKEDTTQKQTIIRSHNKLFLERTVGT